MEQHYHNFLGQGGKLGSLPLGHLGVKDSVVAYVFLKEVIFDPTISEPNVDEILTNLHYLVHNLEQDFSCAHCCIFPSFMSSFFHSSQ